MDLRFKIVDTFYCPLTGMVTTMYYDREQNIFEHYTEQTGQIQYTERVKNIMPHLKDFEKLALVEANRLPDAPVWNMKELGRLLNQTVFKYNQ